MGLPWVELTTGFSTPIIVQRRGDAFAPSSWDIRILTLKLDSGCRDLHRATLLRVGATARSQTNGRW
jgi:hypothetical protein